MTINNKDLITINGTKDIYEIVKLVEGGCIVSKDKRRTEFFVSSEHIDEIISEYVNKERSNDFKG